MPYIYVFQIFVENLACLFCLRSRPCGTKNIPQPTDAVKENPPNGQQVNFFYSPGNETANQELFPTNTKNIPSSMEVPSKVEKELIQMRKSLQEMTVAIVNNITQEQAFKTVQQEWRIVALVLDRIFFIIYLIAIIGSLIFLFPRPP